jgi:hypothetical protein
MLQIVAYGNGERYQVFFTKQSQKMPDFSITYDLALAKQSQIHEKFEALEGASLSYSMHWQGASHMGNWHWEKRAGKIIISLLLGSRSEDGWPGVPQTAGLTILPEIEIQKN